MRHKTIRPPSRQCIDTAFEIYCRGTAREIDKKHIGIEGKVAGITLFAQRWLLTFLYVALF